VHKDGSGPDAGHGARVKRLELCLAFANTLHWHASNQPHETLHTYEDFLAWSEGQNLISRHGVAALTRRGRREPRAAAAVYSRATSLREAIYRVFVACIARKAPADQDTRRLNEELQRAVAHYRIEFGTTTAAWCHAREADELDGPLWSIVQSAAELLLAEDLRERVGQCADAGGCGWLFLDLSKNHSRRWCSMQDCGNRAKQHRLQARPK